MGEVGVLAGEVVKLRPFRRGDADDLVAGCNDPLTQRFLPLLPSPYTRADALWWINEGSPAAFAAGGSGVRDRRPDDRPAHRRWRHQPRARRGRRRSATGWHRWARARGRHRRLPDARDARVRPRPAAAERLTAPSWRTRRASGSPSPPGSPGRASNGGGGRSRDGWPARPHRVGPAATATRATRSPAAARPARPLRDRPGHLTDGVITLRPLRPAGRPRTPTRCAASPRSSRPRCRRWHRTWPRSHARCARAQAGWLAGERADFTIRDAATDAYAGEIGLYYWESADGSRR